MKALVMTVAMAITGMANAVSGNAVKGFAYNEVVNGGRVESQVVYKVEGEKYLKHHLKYDFCYDAEGRIIRKETLKWNEIEQAYQRYYCLNYNYSEGATAVEYALWNDGDGDYTQVKGKALYMTDATGMSYLSYEWDEKNNDWRLLVEHRANDADMQLLADK